MSEDWHITPKQIILIQDRIKNLSKREGSLIIGIIEAIYLSRPSSQNLPDNREQTVKLATEDTTGR